MANYKGAPKTPPKKGTVTGTLQMKNLEIDGKTLMLIDDRVGTAERMSLKVGDKILYRQLSQGIEKGKINYIAFDDGSADQQQPAPAAQPAQPAPGEEKKPEPPATQIVQGEYLSHTSATVTLKDCKGNAEAWKADIGILKILSKPDCQVQPGTKVKAMLVQQAGEWVMSKLGPADPNLEEKPFKSGKDILEKNLKDQQAEQAKSDAALAQINKENAEGDKRIEENKEYLKTLTEPSGTEKPMPTTESTTEPEKCQQDATVNVPEAPGTTDPIKECPVELKVHLDCGSYSNFDLTVPGLPIDQAIGKIEADAKKAIAMMHRLMAEAKKGY